MAILTSLFALVFPGFALAGQQASIPKIAPIGAPVSAPSSLNLPSIPSLAVPGLPESVVVPGVSAALDAPAAALQAPGARLQAVPAANAVPNGGRDGSLPLAAKAQLDAIGARLGKGASAAPASPAQDDSLNGAFDNAGSRKDDVSAVRPATVFHLQQDGGRLGSEKRGHQDFRNEDVPFPVPPELQDDVPSAREKAPVNWTGLISLHLHSVYSDGTLSPAQLMEEAFKQGVRVVALTDHDSTAGIAEAKKRAEELGMTFIAGEEMTARGGVHIGALGLDVDNPDLVAHNERVRQNRLARAQKIIEHLNAQFRDNPSKDAERGLVLTLEEVKAHTKHDQGGTIEIPAIARVLLDHGLIAHVDDAFDTYLTDKILSDPSIEPDPTVEEVLDVIHKAGGKAFLNHPYTVRGRTPQDKDNKVQAMLGGFDGIEAYRESNATSDAGRERFDQRVAKYLSWAKSNKLMVGNGADYHGPDTHLNHLVVNMPKHYAGDLLDGLGIPEAKSLLNDPTPPTPAKAAPVAAILPLAGVSVPHVLGALAGLMAGIFGLIALVSATYLFVALMARPGSWRERIKAAPLGRKALVQFAYSSSALFVLALAEQLLR